MKLKKIIASVVCMGLAIGCSTHQNSEKERSYYPTVTNSHNINEGEYAVVQFEQGDNTLTDESKAKLKSFVDSAQYGGRDIENIKILSWSDTDAKSGSATDFDRSIATERSEAIEEYLKEDLKTGADYANYNMVEKQSVHDIFKSEDWKRQPFSKAESRTLPQKDDDQLASLMENKPSRALVVVEYQ